MAIPVLANLEKVKIVAFIDAAFVKLLDGWCQGGSILVLVDNDKYICCGSLNIEESSKAIWLLKPSAMVDAMSC